MTAVRGDVEPRATAGRRRLAVAYLLVVLVPAGAVVLLLLGTGGAAPDSAPRSAPLGPVALMLVAVPVVLTTAHLCGYLAHRFGQPRVIGEMAGGLLLGPSALGALFPEAHQALFSPQLLPVLDGLAQLGVVFFMCRVGMELNTELLRGRGLAAVVVGHGALAVPLVAGIALGFLLPAGFRPEGTSTAAFVLFVGLSLSVSALPVLAAILRQRGLLDSPAGSLGLAAAGIGDATVWWLLSVLLVFSGRGDPAAVVRTAVLAAVFVAVLHLLVRPALRALLARLERRDRDRYSASAFLTLFVLLCALAGDRIGIHPVIGAFLAGAVLPRSSGVVENFAHRSEGLTNWLLLPLFFASVGLRTDLGAVPSVLPLLAVLLVAVAAKFGGTVLAALLVGRPLRESLSLGAMLNCRGLTELVILDIGRSLGLVGDELFAILVVVTLVTTLATGPLLGVLRPSTSEKGTT